MTPTELVEKVTEITGFTQASGVDVIQVQPGHAKLSLEKKHELTQFNGSFHGGVISGIADHAAGAAATTSLPEGRIAVTIDLHVDFLSAASGPKIVADATVVLTGSTICVGSVRLLNEVKREQNICAIATVTLRSVEMPQFPKKRDRRQTLE